LSGKWNNDLDADFVCGFGELTLKLPENIGVKVKATGIMGNVEAPGFSKDGSTYTNDAFRKTKVTLYIDIFGGIGNVNLDLVE
jgi:predicted membrane protein